jgi:hypothetical protein
MRPGWRRRCNVEVAGEGAPRESVQVYASCRLSVAEVDDSLRRVSLAYRRLQSIVRSKEAWRGA